MGFERFTQAGRAFRPKASIRSTGQIGFSHGCVERYALEKTPYAVLFYDSDARKVGIKPTTEKNEEGALRLSVRSGNGSISARSFFDYYSIEYSKTRSFDVVYDEQIGMLIINLSQPEKRVG
jgi:hypothetical protein